MFPLVYLLQKVDCLQVDRDVLKPDVNVHRSLKKCHLEPRPSRAILEARSCPYMRSPASLSEPQTIENTVEIFQEDAIWQSTDPLQISRRWNMFSDVTRDVRRRTAWCCEEHSLCREPYRSVTLVRSNIGISEYT